MSALPSCCLRCRVTWLLFCRRLHSALHLAVEKRIRSDEGCDERLHAAAVVAIGFVGGLQNGGIVEGFVASHPEAEGVADEDLLAREDLVRIRPRGQNSCRREVFGDRSAQVARAWRG